MVYGRLLKEKDDCQTKEKGDGNNKEKIECQWMSNLNITRRSVGNQMRNAINFSCSLKKFMIDNEIEYPENLKYEALYDRTIEINIVDYYESDQENTEWTKII